jgi:hypothetical protein
LKSKYKKRSKQQEEMRILELKVTKRVRKLRQKILEKKDSNLCERDQYMLVDIENQFVKALVKHEAI